MLNLAYATQRVLGDGEYAVAYDTRKSSTPLGRAISAGLAWLNSSVIDLGIVPTPVLAFSVLRWGYKAVSL